MRAKQEHVGIFGILQPWFNRELLVLLLQFQITLAMV
jgi:hypothetical protein